MFELKKTVSRNSQTDLDDTANIKFALTSMGYYDDTESGLSPYSDDDLFTSIQSYQKDNELEPDGVIKPDGPTQYKMKESLKKDKKAGNAFTDFARNYFDMRKANTINADKYFHCKANYEAAERGNESAKRAEQLSKARIKYKKRFKNDTSKDIFEDQGANIYGREAAKSGKFTSAREACEVFRPNGLDDKY